MAESPTPTPTPSADVLIPADIDPIDQLIKITPEAVGVIAMAIILILAAAILMTWAVLRAATLPPPTALITSLSLLSLFATAGGIVTNNNAAWTIAAAGVGALAGSVTSLFQQGKYTPDEVGKAVAVVQELDRQENEENPRA